MAKFKSIRTKISNFNPLETEKLISYNNMFMIHKLLSAFQRKTLQKYLSILFKKKCSLSEQYMRQFQISHILVFNPFQASILMQCSSMFEPGYTSMHVLLIHRHWLTIDRQDMSQQPSVFEVISSENTGSTKRVKLENGNQHR